MQLDPRMCKFIWGWTLKFEKLKLNTKELNKIFTKNSLYFTKSSNVLGNWFITGDPIENLSCKHLTDILPIIKQRVNI